MEPGHLETCLIGLGSNLGDRQGTLEKAVARLRAAPGIYRVEVSRFLETNPVGGPEGQPAFLNAAVTCVASCSPEAMLDRLQAIEHEMGRVREVRWDARTLDLDLLLFGVRRFESDRLTIPHPRLATRRFVLDPAADLAGNWLHPELGMTLNSLSSRIKDIHGEYWLLFPDTQRHEAEIVAAACQSVPGRPLLALKAIREAELATFQQHLDLATPRMTLVLAAAGKNEGWTKTVKRLLRAGKLGPTLCLTMDNLKTAAAEAAAAIGSALNL
jgi:2-amino-4-hydroxy-6-hydroxymethyldihydropteridine diphosphokinase